MSGYQTQSDPMSNPFKMPTDQEVFRLRDEEKRQKNIEREKLKYQRVHEKTTWSARIGASNVKGAMADESMKEGSKVDASQLEVHLPSVDIRENDNMAVYIAKKREMGLIRMSLATKRQEIRKLEEEAERAENRVRQQEEQLDETEDKFEAFLKHSEMESVEAIKRADTASKEKSEKIAEIKKLSTQIAAIETDKKKNEELLSTCLDFKYFLDGLTPSSFFRDTLYDYLCQRERARLTAAFEASFELAEGATEAEERQLEQDRQAMLQSMEEQYTDSCAQIEQRLDTLSAEEIKAEVDGLDPEPEAMYFTKPEQILAKFVEIEEGNLFLITTCQELEGEIEAVAQTYQKEQQEMIRNAEARRTQMEAVSQKIQVEQAKMKQLQERIDRARDTGTTTTAVATKTGEKPQEAQRKKTQEELKQDIEEKVKTIFRTLPGHGEDSNTLTMLTHIEMKLEDMRQYVKSEKSGIAPVFVNEEMKKRDKERRQEIRKQNQNELRELREKRSLLALSRSQAPVKKRVGKPVMWRSRPLDQKKQETTTKEETQADADDEFFQ